MLAGLRRLSIRSVGTGKDGFYNCIVVDAIVRASHFVVVGFLVIWYRSQWGWKD